MKKLLNPIEFYNDRKLLIVNLIIFAVGTALAVLMQAWFSSTIQLLFKSKISIYETTLENIISISLLTFVFFVAGKIINRKTRLIDCLNLSLYTRIPFYIISLLNFNGALSRNMPIELEDGSIKIPSPSALANSTDYIISFITSCLNIVVIIFLIIVIYRSFKTLSNAKKTSDYIIFVVLFLLITIFSPVIINLI